MIVPGITDSPQQVEAMLKLVSGANVLKVELLPYHTMGVEKWAKLGYDYPLAGVLPPANRNPCAPLTRLWIAIIRKSRRRKKAMNINFGPMPFFHLNGLLNEEQTREQLLGAKQVGYGGVALLPVFETRPSFLSDAYFDQYEVFLKTCRELGLQVILYDDRDFPSGIAGNKIEQAPEHVSKALTKTEKAVFGPALYEEVLSPEGYLCSAAMNTATRETFDLAPYIQNGCLCWNVPEGEFLVMHFSLAAGGHTAVVDYLNPASCQVFLDLALTPYWNRFKTYFGDPIIMTFTDDIAFYHTHHAKAWTPGL